MHTISVTSQDHFSAMRGHVADGVVVHMFDDTVVVVRPTMLGWRLVDSMTAVPLRSCRSALELERAVVTYDGSWT